MGRILCSVVTIKSKEHKEEYIINTDVGTGSMMDVLNVVYIATISHPLKKKSNSSVANR